MSAANGSAAPGDPTTMDKGKVAAAAAPGQNPDMSMGEDDEDSSEEESGIEEVNVEAEEQDDDNMEEIDTSNILGRRTRGKAIDYAEAEQKAKEAGDTLEDDDDDEDEDFEAAGGAAGTGPADTGDKMEL